MSSLTPLSGPGVAIVSPETYTKCFDTISSAPDSSAPLYLSIKPHHGDLRAKTASGKIVFDVKRKSWSLSDRRDIYDGRGKLLFQTRTVDSKRRTAETLGSPPKRVFATESSGGKKNPRTKVMLHDGAHEVWFTPSTKHQDGIFKLGEAVVAIVDKPKRGFFTDREIRVKVAQGFDPAIVFGTLVALTSATGSKKGASSGAIAGAAGASAAASAGGGGGGC
jgi:hypothetical protein